MEGNFCLLSLVMDQLGLQKHRQNARLPQRSKASPLKIRIEEGSFLKDVFHLTIPHLGRLEDFFLSVSSNDFLEFTEHLCSPAPLIKTLSFNVTDTEQPILRDGVFGGDLSSLRDLSLNGVVADLAWDGMSNLLTSQATKYL